MELCHWTFLHSLVQISKRLWILPCLLLFFVLIVCAGCIVQAAGDVVDILFHFVEADDRKAVCGGCSAFDQGFPVREGTVEEECLTALFTSRNAADGIGIGKDRILKLRDADQLPRKKLPLGDRFFFLGKIGRASCRERV